MAELWKDKLNRQSLSEFALVVKSTYDSFLVDDFVDSVMDKTWDSLELMARGRQICLNLGKFLPADYGEAIGILDKVISSHKALEIFSIPTFIEVFGQNDADWNISISAMERFTIYASCEFTVRPFIINDENRMMEQMNKWSEHENEHVRRLSSEGCRPSLPWGTALESFKKDPSPVLPILTRLKTDSSAYVRKSVANNLNDISKTHPDLVIKLARDWYGKNKDTDWIIKHACRTLLKKGNRDALAIFGFNDISAVDVSDFAFDAVLPGEIPVVKIGDEITFSFTIIAKEASKVRIEYGIDYVKANGKRNRKVFQISELPMKLNQKKPYTRKHSFEDLSTRRHYPGVHSITLIVNGAERGALDFELK